MPLTIFFSNPKWRPPSLSELTPYEISLGLTHQGSETSKYNSKFPLSFHLMDHLPFDVKVKKSRELEPLPYTFKKCQIIKNHN